MWYKRIGTALLGAGVAWIGAGAGQGPQPPHRPAPVVVCRPAQAMVPAPHVVVAPPMMPAVYYLKDRPDYLIPCSQVPLPAERAAMLAAAGSAGGAVVGCGRDSVAVVRANLSPGERMVMVQAVCVQVPAGFCQRVGLTNEPGQGDAGRWVLTARETRMFDALLRAEAGKQVITRPRLMVTEHETGRVHVGQEVAVATALEATSKDGAMTYVAKVQTLPTGVQLDVTPTIAADGKIQLRVHARLSALEQAPVQVPVLPAQGQAQDDAGAVRTIAVLGTVNAADMETTVEMTDGATVVIASTGKKPAETLWVLTPHVVVGRPKE
jgi:hypothetical protein